jgi:hypothetical protein
MSIKKNKSTSRRDFIKTAGLGVGVAAVAGGVLSAGGAEATPVFKDEKSKGYHESEHVKKYYESAKF